MICFRFPHRAAGALVGLLLTGCGGSNLISVTGRVTYHDRPVTAASLIFQPLDASQGRPALASLDEDGRFAATTRTKADGLAPGAYRIAIDTDKRPDSDAHKARSRPTLPPRYADAATSGLTVTVSAQEGAKTINLELKD